MSASVKISLKETVLLRKDHFTRWETKDYPLNMQYDHTPLKPLRAGTVSDTVMRLLPSVFFEKVFQ